VSRVCKDDNSSWKDSSTNPWGLGSGLVSNEVSQRIRTSLEAQNLTIYSNKCEYKVVRACSSWLGSTTHYRYIEKMNFPKLPDTQAYHKFHPQSLRAHTHIRLPAPQAEKLSRDQSIPAISWKIFSL
jgi:hypothetical protein